MPKLVDIFLLIVKVKKVQDYLPYNVDEQLSFIGKMRSHVTSNTYSRD